MLFRFEMKKLLGRRGLWVVLALGLFMIAMTGKTLVEDRLNGRVAGLRAVYGRFEGQALTDAIAAEAQTWLNGYIADHPDEFESDVDPDLGMTYYPIEVSSYAGGLWEACSLLCVNYTWEQELAYRDKCAAELSTGIGEDGKPLSKDTMESYRQLLAQDPQPEIIRYMEGYKQIGSLALPTGLAALMLLTLTMVPLFAGERTARMEALLLTGARRKQAVRAKLLAAMTWALGMYVLLWGILLLFVGLTYGFTGFNAPLDTFNPSGNNVIPGQALVTYLAVSLAVVLAQTALCAWMSAALRRPLTSLMGSVLTEAAQIFLSVMTGGYYCFIYFNFSLPDSVMNALCATRWWSPVRDMLLTLPASALFANDSLYAISGTQRGALYTGSGALYDTLSNIGAQWTLGLIPAALALALGLWRASASFLAPRRA